MTIKQKKLCVYTKQCSKNKQLLKCSNCKRNNQETWHFESTNKGEANICAKCKPTVLKRSFANEDAMSRTIHSGHYGSRNMRQWY